MTRDELGMQGIHLGLVRLADEVPVLPASLQSYNSRRSVAEKCGRPIQLGQNAISQLHWVDRHGMGRLYLEYLEGKVYTCKYCETHLAACDELVSRSFHSRNGKAYLFNAVVNVTSGPKEERLMTTGRHEVSDLHCTCCMQLVGWKYDHAEDKTQKYKEGKYILERSKVVDIYEGPPKCIAESLLLESDCEEGLAAQQLA